MESETICRGEAATRQDPIDIIAEYKTAFFHCFGELLTLQVEECPERDEPTKMISDGVRDIVMAVREKFHEGTDGKEDYFRIMGCLIALVNASDKRDSQAIALKASFLVSDVSKIIKKINLQEEMKDAARD